MAKTSLAVLGVFIILLSAGSSAFPQGGILKGPTPPLMVNPERPPSPPPSTAAAPPPPAVPLPPGSVPEKGVINPRTGEFYPGTMGGVVNPKTGDVLPKVEGGYVNPKTGEFLPVPK